MSEAIQDPFMGRKFTGTAICIHKVMPTGCPLDGCGLPLYGSERAPGAPDTTLAFQCEKGHKMHIYKYAVRGEG